MTDLTDKWKKGELPDGWYWVEGCRNKEIYAYTSEYLNHMYRPKNSDRIVEQVPSYEEWDKLNNACHELEKENACLTVDIVKLKELLKLARGLMNCTKDWACTEATENIIAKINQALGEEQ